MSMELTHNLLQQELLKHQTRRHFLKQGTVALGAMWMGAQAQASKPSLERDPQKPQAPVPTHHMPRAKRVIYLQMTGAPSQLDLFDYKPELVKHSGKDCPAEFLNGKRFAFITGTPQLLGPAFPFHQEKQTGQWISNQLPLLEQMLPEICFVKSMHSDQFNHAPAQLLALTGNVNLGYASLGAWSVYGMGSENQNLPGFVVLLSGGQSPDAGKGAWGNGFLPSVYQGVQCRSEGDPVLYLSNPKGVSRELRGLTVDAISKINRLDHQLTGDPETTTRISQYEMAFRMQMSATEAMDLSQEPKHIHELYGTNPGRESFSNNCLLARRLIERDVRFVQLFDWGWDHHSSLDKNLPNKCKQIDRPIAALLTDLKQRGLLEETLVVFAGEFGRTPMQENRGGVAAKSPGRDHHVDAFTIWMAGGGVKGGMSYGETDEIGFGAAVNPVTTQDLNATILHLMGMDPHKLSYAFQGLNQRLIGVQPANIVHDLIA